ncbi:hypothetical protein [Methanobrevibacter ruminantium]|nr:hypothetical protein [Methanobrevibacter ruminantium]
MKESKNLEVFRYPFVPKRKIYFEKREEQYDFFKGSKHLSLKFLD